MKALLASLVLLPLALTAQEDAEPPPSTTFGEHASTVLRLAVDAKEKVLYSVDKSGGVHAWDLKKAELIWEREVKFLNLTGFEVGEKELFYSDSMAVILPISVKSGEIGTGTGAPNPTMEIRCLAADPKGRWVWLGCDNGVAIRLTPGDANAWTTRPMKNGGIFSMALDKAAKQLAVGGKDFTIRFINATSAMRDEEKVLEGHVGPVTALAFDARGSKLVSGSEDKTVRIWNAANGKPILLLEGHESPIRSLAVDPKGRWIASGDDAGVLKIWTLQKGEEQCSIETDHDSPITDLCFIDKGKTLLGAAGGEEITRWDLSGL